VKLSLVYVRTDHQDDESHYSYWELVGCFADVEKFAEAVNEASRRAADVNAKAQCGNLDRGEPHFAQVEVECVTLDEVRQERVVPPPEEHLPAGKSAPPPEAATFVPTDCECDCPF
jgi:hypothetical protein